MIDYCWSARTSFILCLRRNLDPSLARLKVSLRRNKPYGRVVAFILALTATGLSVYDGRYCGDRLS
jgi:hypothetical protein